HNLTYHSDFIHAEDYELWLRASKLFKLANYPKELLMYRTHPKQITREFSKVQEQISIKILNSQLKELGVDYDQSKITLINRFFNKSVYENDELKVILEFIEIVLSANKKAKLYDQERLKKFFKKNLNIIWNRCTMYNYDTFYQFNKSIVTGISDISLNLYVKMLKRVLF
ncbi:MAG: hypothetical protein M3421_04950, partial [Bacteroidota bacterium]|nr:hypothetical protein [Bacteroidota bacterium]